MLGLLKEAHIVGKAPGEGHLSSELLACYIPADSAAPLDSGGEVGGEPQPWGCEVQVQRVLGAGPRELPRGRQTLPSWCIGGHNMTTRTGEESVTGLLPRSSVGRSELEK